MSNPDRFLGRAAVYAGARPGYPAALAGWMSARGLLRGRVADIGAGTGLFTRLLLDAGAHVTALEPNPEMRAELLTAMAPEVRAGQLDVLDGTAEATGLPAASVSLVTAAQAAHWFDPIPTAREFGRVLEPGGLVLLVWNDWRGVDAPFNRAYGEVVRAFSDTDTPEVVSRVPDRELPQFFPSGFETRAFDHPVPFTRERLRALAGSVSYLPAPGGARSKPLAAALDAAFEAHQHGAEVTLHYQTHAYLGRPN